MLINIALSVTPHGIGATAGGSRYQLRRKIAPADRRQPDISFDELIVAVVAGPGRWWMTTIFGRWKSAPGSGLG